MTTTVPQATASKATQISTDLAGKLDGIRSRADLTADARLRQIAAAYQDAVDAVATLQASWQSDAVTSKSTLERQLFGALNVVGADAVSIRDADDRAAEAEEPEEALALLERAEISGDQVLARAVALRAFRASSDFLDSQDWSRVLDAYVGHHPETAAKLSELQDAQSTGVQSWVMAHAWFYVPKPTELSAMSDYVILGLAGRVGAR